MRVFTNKPPCGPKRGPGAPQPRFVLDVRVDKIAHDLGLDPVAMRKKYLVEDGTKTVNRLTITTCGLGESIDRVVEGGRMVQARSRKGEAESRRLCTRRASMSMG